MKLYTVQLSKWRQCIKLGIPLKDVTVKSGDRVFAPTWDFLMEHKRGGSDRDYIDKFIPLMRKSYTENKQHWINLCNEDQVAIGCYCRSGDFCHRNLLVGMIQKVCQAENIPFENGGEIE